MRPDLVRGHQAHPRLGGSALDGGGRPRARRLRARCRRIAEDPRIREAFPALAEGAGAIGSLQIRSRATVGGNLANASPCMDTAPPLLGAGRARSGSPDRGGSARDPARRVLPRGEEDRAGARRDRDGGASCRGRSPGLRSAFDKIKRAGGHDLALVNAAAAFDPVARHDARGHRELRGDAGARRRR